MITEFTSVDELLEAAKESLERLLKENVDAELDEGIAYESSFRGWDDAKRQRKRNEAKRKIDEDSFKDEYKDASKDDYASDEVIESAASVYSEMFEEDDDQKWVIKKIGDLKKTTKDDTRFNVKGMKRCKVTLENKKADDDAKSSEKKVDCKAYFYKGKLVALVPDFSSYGLDDLY